MSDVDPARGVTIGGFFVPGLTSRQSETTVRLGDGQSFAIAGLLSNRVRSQIDKIPLLGDLPILGALFRSVDYRRDESELLVVITARLARPLAPHEVPALPTDDELNDPGDFELFLLGLEGRRPGPAAPGGGTRRAIARGLGARSERPDRFHSLGRSAVSMNKPSVLILGADAASRGRAAPGAEERGQPSAATLAPLDRALEEYRTRPRSVVLVVVAPRIDAAPAARWQR